MAGIGNDAELEPLGYPAHPRMSELERFGSTYLNFHGLSMRLDTSSTELLEYCQSLFQRQLSRCSIRPSGVLRLSLVDTPAFVSPSPPATIVYRRHDMACTADGAIFWIELRGKGVFVIDQQALTVMGQVSPDLLADANMLDRLLVASLAFLLRDRGVFPIHAFAAAWRNQALLLAGGSGSGKTTAGLALLRAGWGFLANDLSLICDAGQDIEVLACPQRIHVTAGTVSLFPELSVVAGSGQGKAGFRIEEVFPNACVDRAPARSLLFVRVGGDQPTQLRRLTARDALLALLPQSFAPWDRKRAAAHLALLGRLAETTAPHQLELGPDLDRIPLLLAGMLEEQSPT